MAGSSALDVSILGCGCVGRALTLALAASAQDAPATIRLWSRRTQRANALVAEGLRLAQTAQARAPATPPPTTLVRSFHAVDALLDARQVIVCVADEALEELAAELAPALKEAGARPTVLFVSGYMPLAALGPLSRAGAAVGRLHPLCPVLPKGDPRALARTSFALEGPPRALRDAKRLARAVGAGTLELRSGPSAGASYHAGAALLGGGLVALFAEAEAAMAPAVRSRTRLREALASFAAEVLRNVASEGPAKALTGPVARGSETLLAGHLAALERRPLARAAYRQLAESMLALGRLDPAATRRLKRLLG